MCADRLVRLIDLAAHEVVVVHCQCGRIVEYRQGVLQRLHRIPSDMLVYDLQFRLRCRHCNRKGGFQIVITDERYRGGQHGPRMERIIVHREG